MQQPRLPVSWVTWARLCGKNKESLYRRSRSWEMFFVARGTISIAKLSQGRILLNICALFSHYGISTSSCSKVTAQSMTPLWCSRNMKLEYQPGAQRRRRIVDSGIDWSRTRLKGREREDRSTQISSSFQRRKIEARGVNCNSKLLVDRLLRFSFTSLPTTRRYNTPKMNQLHPILILALLTILADATPIMVRINGRINTREFAGRIICAIWIFLFFSCIAAHPSIIASYLRILASCSIIYILWP